MMKELKPRNVNIFFLYFKSALDYFRPHNLEHILTSVTQSKVFNFLLHSIEIVELNKQLDGLSKEALPLRC